MSRRKARRSNAATPEDTHASQRVPNRALQLPTELVYTILTISIGDYLSDLMLYPSKIERWDATLTFLHVSHTFRSCTIKLLYHLWGDTFIREKTKFVLSLTEAPHRPPLTGILVSSETTSRPTPSFAACPTKLAARRFPSLLKTTNQNSSLRASCATPYHPSRASGRR